MKIISHSHWIIEPQFESNGWLSSSLPWPWLFVSVWVAFLLSLWLLTWRRRKTAPALLSGFGSRSEGPLPSYRCSLPQLNFALSRARRYQHPIAVVILSWGREQLAQSMRNLAGGWANANLAAHFYSSFIGSLLRDNLRESDILTYDATEDQYVILLTETSASGAEYAMLRLNELVFKHTAVYLRVGVAEFPTDGLIIEDLFNHAQAKCNCSLTKVDLLSIDAAKGLATPVVEAPVRKSNGAHSANGAVKALVQSLS